ncbi:MAG: uracil phosphoribosyltransferase, partial [Gemmataceae bacterium]
MVSPGVHVSRHPLVLHKLAILRDKNTPPTLFRAMVRDLSVLLFAEASADLPLDPLTIETPLAPMEQQR